MGGQRVCKGENQIKTQTETDSRELDMRKQGEGKVGKEREGGKETR